jgi:phosphate:Na+ symporter
MAASVRGSVDWFALIVQLPGGLALFLFGMKMLGVHIKLAAGAMLQDLMLKLAVNKLYAFVAGLVVTALTSSLSLVSVLLVQFVAADMVSFEASLPILFGAGVGSTFISVLQVLSVTKYGMLLISIGFFAKLCVRSSPSPKVDPTPPSTPHRLESAGAPNAGTLSGAGGASGAGTPRGGLGGGSATAESQREHIFKTVFALGVIFIGMETMSGSFKWARTNAYFLTMLESLENVPAAIIAGTAFTLVIQSSGATMGVILSLANQGVISAHAGAALALGANIGTCGSAFLAAAGGQSHDALHVAIALLIGRALGVFVVACAFPLFELVVGAVAFVDPDPAVATPAQVGRYIAAAHTLFNVLLAVAIIPVSGRFAALVRRVAGRLLGRGAGNVLPA